MFGSVFSRIYSRFLPLYKNPSTRLAFFHGLHSGQDFDMSLNAGFVLELLQPSAVILQMGSKMTLRRGWVDVNQSLPKILAEGLIAH